MRIGLKRYVNAILLALLVAIGILMLPLVLFLAKIGIKLPYEKVIRKVRSGVDDSGDEIDGTNENGTETNEEQGCE